MDHMNTFLSLIPKDEADIGKVIKALYGWKCCPRCILRFLGEKEVHAYRKTKGELENWLMEFLGADKPAETKEMPSSCTGDLDRSGGDYSPTSEQVRSDAENHCSQGMCVACIGVLQDNYCSQQFCQELFGIIQKENFQFDNYYMSLSIPVPLIVREYALFVKLKELLPKIYDESVRAEITPIKEAWKWANGSAMTRLLGVPFDQRSVFEVKLNFIQPDLEKDCHFLYDLYPEVFRKRKNNKHGWEVFTRVNVPKALEDMGEVTFQKNFQCPPNALDLPCDCDPIICSHEAIYFAGRYNKYSRKLSQTPWIVNGERIAESSVEEMICEDLLEAARGKEYKLSASGREDVDVLMLGRGRPFVVEMTNPRRVKFTLAEMKEIQNKINSTHTEVKVRDLQLISSKDTVFLKQGEEEKIKTYSAKCWINKTVTQEFLDKTLGDLKDLVLKQKTPIRVLHRRSVAVRNKTIHSISTKVLNSQNFHLNLSTQAGTYIKEFVHGDFGRTKPNLGTLLGGECDILELNVEAVELDWPKQLDDLDT